MTACTYESSAEVMQVIPGSLDYAKSVEFLDALWFQLQPDLRHLERENRANFLKLHDHYERRQRELRGGRKVA